MKVIINRPSKAEEIISINDNGGNIQWQYRNGKRRKWRLKARRMWRNVEMTLNGSNGGNATWLAVAIRKLISACRRRPGVQLMQWRMRNDNLGQLSGVAQLAQLFIIWRNANLAAEKAAICMQ